MISLGNFLFTSSGNELHDGIAAPTMPAPIPAEVCLMKFLREKLFVFFILTV
jgi:hypothetical protein